MAVAAELAKLGQGMGKYVEVMIEGKRATEGCGETCLFDVHDVAQAPAPHCYECWARQAVNAKTRPEEAMEGSDGEESDEDGEESDEEDRQ